MSKIGQCKDCFYWWPKDGYCPRLGIVRQPTFGCTEYRERFIDEKVCKTCVHWSNGNFCRLFTIVVKGDHGCRKHSLKTVYQLEKVLDNG